MAKKVVLLVEYDFMLDILADKVQCSLDFPMLDHEGIPTDKKLNKNDLIKAKLALENVLFQFTEGVRDVTIRVVSKEQSVYQVAQRSRQNNGSAYEVITRLVDSKGWKYKSHSLVDEILGLPSGSAFDARKQVMDGAIKLNDEFIIDDSDYQKEILLSHMWHQKSIQPDLGEDTLFVFLGSGFGSFNAQNFMEHPENVPKGAQLQLVAFNWIISVPPLFGISSTIVGTGTERPPLKYIKEHAVDEKGQSVTIDSGSLKKSQVTFSLPSSILSSEQPEEVAVKLRGPDIQEYIKKNQDLLEFLYQCDDKQKYADFEQARKALQLFLDGHEKDPAYHHLSQYRQEVEQLHRSGLISLEKMPALTELTYRVMHHAGQPAHKENNDRINALATDLSKCSTLKRLVVVCLALLAVTFLTAMVMAIVASAGTATPIVGLLAYIGVDAVSASVAAGVGTVGCAGFTYLSSRTKYDSLSTTVLGLFKLKPVKLDAGSKKEAEAVDNNEQTPKQKATP